MSAADHLRIIDMDTDIPCWLSPDGDGRDGFMFTAIDSGLDVIWTSSCSSICVTSWVRQYQTVCTKLTWSYLCCVGMCMYFFRQLEYSKDKHGIDRGRLSSWRNREEACWDQNTGREEGSGQPLSGTALTLPHSTLFHTHRYPNKHYCIVLVVLFTECTHLMQVVLLALMYALIVCCTSLHTNTVLCMV